MQGKNVFIPIFPNIIMKKAILMDLDNTLVDFMKYKIESCRSAVDSMIKHGLKIDKKEAIKKLFNMYGRHGIEEGRILQKFLMEVNGKIDYKILSNGISAYRKMRFGNLKPYKDVEKTLKKLRKMGYKLAILSDAPRLKCWIRLASIGLTDYFDTVIAYEDTRKKKPHTLPFKKALRKLKCGPSEVVMVGDNIARDIFGAKKMGIATVFAAYGNPEDAELAYKGIVPDYYKKVNPRLGNLSDYTINSFKELPKLLRKL